MLYKKIGVWIITCIFLQNLNRDFHTLWNMPVLDCALNLVSKYFNGSVLYSLCCSFALSVSTDCCWQSPQLWLPNPRKKNVPVTLLNLNQAICGAPWFFSMTELLVEEPSVFISHFLVTTPRKFSFTQQTSPPSISPCTALVLLCASL